MVICQSSDKAVILHGEGDTTIKIIFFNSARLDQSLNTSGLNSMVRRRAYPRGYCWKRLSLFRHRHVRCVKRPIRFEPLLRLILRFNFEFLIYQWSSFFGLVLSLLGVVRALGSRVPAIPFNTVSHRVFYLRRDKLTMFLVTPLLHTHVHFSLLNVEDKTIGLLGVWQQLKNQLFGQGLQEHFIVFRCHRIQLVRESSRLKVLLD